MPRILPATDTQEDKETGELSLLPWLNQSRQIIPNQLSHPRITQIKNPANRAGFHTGQAFMKINGGVYSGPLDLPDEVCVA